MPSKTPRPEGKKRLKFIDTFIDDSIGARSEEVNNEPSFESLPEDEQADLMYNLQSLLAERRDLVRSLQEARSESTAEQPAQAFVMKKIGKHFVKKPVNAPAPFSQEKAKSIDDAESRLVEVKSQLLEVGKQPGVREAYEKKLTRFYFLMKAAKRLEEWKQRLAMIEEEMRTLSVEAKKGKSGSLIGAKLEVYNQLQAERDGLIDNLHIPEEYDAGQQLERFMELKEYSHAAVKGRIIEVPTVEKTVNEGLEAMRRHQPFMLAGHLGSGKTEVARHMARLFMLENGVGYDPNLNEDLDEVYDRLQPEVFSGAEEASVYDLIGKLKLTGRAMDAKSAAKAAKEMQVELAKHGVKDMPIEELIKGILGQSNITETVFNYGPLGRALRDGKPIIIDEINLMPPEVVGRINDLLLRPVGSKVRLQENGEEEFVVKPGFTVLATLNLGHQYAGVREFNAAFASRWVGREVDYPTVEEDFDLILATLMRKDRTRLPPNFPAAEYEKLIDLAVVTREIQELFSGQTEGQRYMAKVTSMEAEKSQLEKVVVSTRDLMRKIVEPWRNSEFKKSLDEIILKNIIVPAAIQSKDDQRFLLELFLRRGFFQGMREVPEDEQDPDGPQKNVPIWTEKTFAAEGIRNISQQEIDALQANMQDFKSSDTKFGELTSSAHERARSIMMGLMIGNSSQRTSSE